MPPTLLVTGATGFLGLHVIAAARPRWRVAATYYNTRRRDAERALAGCDHGRIDLTDYRDVRDMLDAVQPTVVLHLAALADPNYCEQHPNESLRVNVEAACNLAGLCADRDIPFIFTSTDLVFDGLHAPYKEEDPPAPISIYGEHKALAEQGVLERHELALVCRMPLMFGFATLGRRTFFQNMVAAFRTGQTLTLFVDEFRTPVSGAVAAQGLLLVAGSGLDEDVNPDGLERVTGFLHLGGRERVSRYNMGLLLAELLDVDPSLAEPVSARDVPVVAARPPDVSLDSSRAYELGYDPPPLRQQMERVLRNE
ncbi:MAG: NAD(P)-dependent oxidoreductase [Caldilineae bacterium]|nr:MAG: NAD(P)-dependent oxidoreductase [Caldilineae bacterium]